VSTADHDDRVVPSHGYKLTAAMQAGQTCSHPIPIDVETEASHGYSPTDKEIAETADMIAFAAANMGLTLPRITGGSFDSRYCGQMRTRRAVSETTIVLAHDHPGQWKPPGSYQDTANSPRR
jgi:hypothetical protein